MEHGAKEHEGEDPPEHVAPDQHQQDLLDEAIEDSFPASDPPSTIPNPDDDDALEDEQKGVE